MKLTKLMFVSTSLLSLFLVGCTDEKSEPKKVVPTKSESSQSLRDTTSSNTSNQKDNTTKLVPPVGAWAIHIIDLENHIYDKEQVGARLYYPGLSISLHARPIMDVDLAVYVNGTYICIQTEVTINNETVWEYNFTVEDSGENTLEFNTVVSA